MPPHIWYYYNIDTIQSEDLVQIISLHYSVIYYWVHRLKIAINSYDTYLHVAIALLNNLWTKAAKMKQKKNSYGHKQVVGFYI